MSAKERGMFQGYFDEAKEREEVRKKVAARSEKPAAEETGDAELERDLAFIDAYFAKETTRNDRIRGRETTEEKEQGPQAVETRMEKVKRGARAMLDRTNRGIGTV